MPRFHSFNVQYAFYTLLVSIELQLHNLAPLRKHDRQKKIFFLMAL